MNTIPIFYACDDNFVKYTIVSLQSMICNASKDYRYHIYVLHTNISEETQNKVFQLKNDHFDISFENVTSYLDSISHRLPIRDYYSKTTYFRLLLRRCSPSTAKRFTSTATPWFRAISAGCT
jgi:lipopolysaccharide biosynthesis glycosyltransferase